MNRWQKIAWFNLIVTVSAFVICLALGGTMPLKEAITPPSPLTFVIVPALVLVAISKFIYRKESKKIDFDERDRQIRQRCKYAGWIAFGSSTMAATMIIYLIIGPKGSLYPLVLPVIPAVGGGLYIIAESVAALIQYGWGGKSHE